jgi:hypothetical protein
MPDPNASSIIISISYPHPNYNPYSSFLGDPIPPSIKLSNSHGLNVLRLLVALPKSLSLLALTFLFLPEIELRSFSGLGALTPLLLVDFSSNFFVASASESSFGGSFLLGLRGLAVVAEEAVEPEAVRASFAAFNLALTLAASASRSEAASLAAMLAIVRGLRGDVSGSRKTT